MARPYRFMVTLGAMSEPTLHPAPPPAGLATHGRGEYEYRVLMIARDMSRSQARRLLVELAEHEHWEVALVRLYAGGARRVWLRRRIIRVVRTA